MVKHLYFVNQKFNFHTWSIFLCILCYKISGSCCLFLYWDRGSFLWLKEGKRSPSQWLLLKWTFSMWPYSRPCHLARTLFEHKVYCWREFWPLRIVSKLNEPKSKVSGKEWVWKIEVNETMPLLLRTFWNPQLVFPCQNGWVKMPSFNVSFRLKFNNSYSVQ